MTFDLGRYKPSGSNRAKQGLPKKQNILEDGSEFGSCLIKAGASFERNADGILLDKDPSSFKQQLSKSLKLHLDYPGIIDEAVQSIRKHLKDEYVFKTFLKPVLLKDEGETSTFGLIGLNDSFLKILLSIEVLQHKLMIFLLEKVVDLSKKEDDEPLCLSVVKQFCWLDLISNPEDVVVKLFEMLRDCPQSLQQGIISSLPEIVSDNQHSQVARSLLDLMSINPHLLLTIIDALDSLNLPDDCLQETKQAVTDMLSSAEIEELPVVLKFLFQHISTDDAFQVVQKIRKNANLSCDLSTRPTSTPYIKAVRKKEANRGAFALVVESLKPLPFHKAVANAWLKAIEELKDTDDVQPIDIFVLLILHSSEDQRRAVENVMRVKVMSGVITAANMKDAFSIKPEIMEDLFKSTMQVAELFLKSSFHVVIQFACNVYKTSFAELNSYCQQEIVGTLVSHIGSGCPSKIDLMLDALIDLVGDHLDMVVPYSAFVNGILDYLDNLDLIQVKKLYQVLGKMAYCSRHGSDMQDGLNIIITKQLSSHVLRYQQIGVVGGLMVVMNLSLASSQEDNDASLSLGRSARIRKKADDNSKQIEDMLELIQSNAERSPQLMALFFEELAVLMRRKCLNQKVQRWIADKIENDFQTDFVVDLKDGLSTNAGTSRHGELVWQVQFMLDELGPDDEDFAINVASLVAKETSLSGTCSGGRSSLWCLSSCFRLLHTCCSSLKENNLEDIDALLGCGVKLPKSFPATADQLECSSDKERVVRLHSAFAVINWFRELLNSFSSQEKEEMRSKVISRLKSIVALHCLIERMLLDYPDYIPPPNIYSSNPEDQTRVGLVLLPKKPRTNKPAKEKTTKGSRGRKRRRNDSDGAADVNLNEDATTNLNITINSTADGGNVAKVANDSAGSNKTSAKSASINKQLLSNYFRELDMDVFQILSFTKLNSPRVVDDEFSKTKLKLDASSLVFLLDDLLLKLNHCFYKNSERRVSFLKTKNESKIIGFNNLNLIGPPEVGNKVCDLIPHLCRYLESLSGYFQVTREHQNETCDLSCFELEENVMMMKSVQLIIQILVAFFSWSDLSSDKVLLKKSISHISDRISPSKSSTLEERFKQAFDYVEKYGRTVDDISSAVQLTKLLSCLSALSASAELQTKAGDVALNFLKQKWKEEEKKADSNLAVAVLLNTSFKHCSDIQALIEVFISSAIPQFLDSQDCSEMFPTLNKDTLSVYYKLLMFYLVENSKTITAGNKDTPINENVDKMLRWQASVMDLRVLIDLIKIYDSRSNLTSALKYGRKFVDLFMRHCIPTFDFLFMSHRDEIQVLFKTLQTSTRALHHLCSHSKIKKDISLTNQVPQLKRALESLIHRVKDMLNKNKCVAAFWLGNLKNRNLKGEELLSQEGPSSGSDDNDDEMGGGKNTKGGANDDYGILVEDDNVDEGQEGASVEEMDVCFDARVEDDEDD